MYTRCEKANKGTLRVWLKGTLEARSKETPDQHPSKHQGYKRLWLRGWPTRETGPLLAIGILVGCWPTEKTLLGTLATPRVQHVADSAGFQTPTHSQRKAGPWQLLRGELQARGTAFLKSLSVCVGPWAMRGDSHDQCGSRGAVCHTGRFA